MIREAEADDGERVREVARSATTASYAMSPQQIDAVLQEQFGDEALERKFDASDTVFLTAVADEGEAEGAIVGFVEADLVADGRGEVRWLFVDPEHRGAGVGTELFEEAVDDLHERGATHVEAVVLADNAEGQAFFERLDFERTGDREVELGGEEFVERVYVEGGAEGSSDEAVDESTDEGPVGLPEDGTAETDDGETLYVTDDEERPGTQASFYLTYVDEGGDERFGYYCGNCGSLDVSMDDMERIRCSNCGNEHRPDDYDDAYL